MLRDTRENFGWLSIAIHWLAAIWVTYFFLNGQSIEESPSPEIRLWHITAGATFGVLLLARVLWRLASPMPRPLGTVAWQNLLAAAVKWALLANIVLAVVSGYLLVWSRGQPVPMLGGLVLPSPTGDWPSLHHLMEPLHKLTVHLFIPLVALHVIGTLKHVFIDKDGTLARMLWPKRAA